MSCPTGSEIKPFIDFLRAYSEQHQQLSAIDCLRWGIKEWQCSRTFKKQSIKMENCLKLTKTRQTHLFKTLTRAFAAVVLVPLIVQKLGY